MTIMYPLRPKGEPEGPASTIWLAILNMSNRDWVWISKNVTNTG